MESSETIRFERRVLLLMALVQFINIWDFMIVMPMGPDFARAMAINSGQAAWVAASYSLAAAFIGVVSASFLDRFDRRSVLVFNLLGLSISTAAMVLATNVWQLIAVRVVAGLFGGTMIASSMAVIADVFPPNRRGEATGKVFGSFSVASVLGVPVGLEVANHWGWWAPFLLIALMALLAVGLVLVFLPPIRYHLTGAVPANAMRLVESLKANPAAFPAVQMTFFSLFAGFLIIPNISAHVQLNLGYPREDLGMLYLVGGMAAFFSMRFVGKRSDSIGYARTSLYATMLLVVALFVGFYLQLRQLPVLLIFVIFMVTMSTRNVTANALVSRIPAPQERAGFMALMASVQSLSSGVGAFVSSLLLSETTDGTLAGMQLVAVLSIASFVFSVWVMHMIERIVLKPA